MSFFGFEQNDLEQERRRFKDDRLDSTSDIPVYTWGVEEGYDGLGDGLQERGDDLNDETFGNLGEVGKDFNFSQPNLPDVGHTSRGEVYQNRNQQDKLPIFEAQFSIAAAAKPTQPSRSPTHGLESRWDNKSPFSVLPKVNGAARSALDQARASPALSAHARSGTPRTGYVYTNDVGLSAQPLALGINQSGIRTLQEIEAEMRVAAQQSRAAEQRQQQQQQQQQQQLYQQQLLEQQHRKEEEEVLYQRRQIQQAALREQEVRRQRLLQQDQLRLLQQQQQQQQQQLNQGQHLRTPPPRMLPSSQSPRFLEHQRQILLMQQQQEQQQQLQLQELQEQLRYEELERQMMSRFNQQLNINTPINAPSVATQAEIQLAHALQQQHLQQRLQSQSPALRGPIYPEQGVPQNIQLQQRLLSELAQAEFLREVQGSQVEQEALRAQAMQKIFEAEKMEERRRRKAAKIAHMSRYNDLMTQSDKDFITRIQVSQLVTQDPYADDFYAQVYGAILRSRMGLRQDERVLKFGALGGVALGVNQRGAGRRPSAMQRMEQQVERIVNNARRREEEKGTHVRALQGALGKTSGRSYKAAPRQLLQVDESPNSESIALDGGGGAKEAAKVGREALGSAAHSDGTIRREPLTHREALVILEGLYDLVLKVEQMRRDQPMEGDESWVLWQHEYDLVVEQLWDGLRVMVPLQISNPHPFISLLGPAKGKRLLPRLTRHLDNQRMLTLLTLLVACFDQLDVIANARLLDSLQDTTERGDADRQTQAFLSSVLQGILPIVAKANLRLVTGLLGLLIDRTDAVKIAQTRPGLALLTLFLSRVEVIKQSMTSATDLSELPSQEEVEQWQTIFDHLFELLAPHLLLLFPSTRIAYVLMNTITSNVSLPPGQTTEIIDQPVWQFLAALALHGVADQHSILVTALREKVLDNMATAKAEWAHGDPEWETKLANVNLFLHAIGIDSSQITV